MSNAGVAANATTPLVPDYAWRACHRRQYTALRSRTPEAIETTTETTSLPGLSGRPVLRFTRDRRQVDVFTAGREGGAIVRIDLRRVPQELKADTNAVGTKLRDVHVLAEAVIGIYEVEREL